MARAESDRLQMAARIFGVVFLVIGIAGFIPGLTTDTDRLGTFGDVAAKVFGIFGVNWLENAAHLLFGVAGLAMSRTAANARAYFLGSGVIYVVLWVYGLVINERSEANFFGLNNAGHWLHLVIGVVMLAIGMMWGAGRPARRAA